MAISRRLLGDPLLRQAAYSAAAAMELIDLPRTKALSNALRYITAAFSFIGGEMFTLLDSRSSSAMACARFRSLDECTRLRICHFLRRHICSLVDRGSFLPKASLSTWLMVVDNPLS